MSIANKTSTAFLNFYLQKLKLQSYEMDASQEAAAKQLQSFWHDAQQSKLSYFFKKTQSNILQMFSKISKKSNPLNLNLNLNLGVYIFGGVGRGKSFLMDAFFEWLPTERKKRVHFHAFMRQLHRDLHDLKHSKIDAMAVICKKLAREIDVLCFDEFHVSDIADAMLLDRLVQQFFRLGVRCIMTSNYAPDTLYPNGLNRERFLPAIALLKQLKVINLDDGTDYRLNKLSTQQLHFDSKLPETPELMQKAFINLSGLNASSTNNLFTNNLNNLNNIENKTTTVFIEQREIIALYQYEQSIWFTFEQICNTPRSQNDYLEIAKQFKYVFVSDIPKMPPRMLMQARRFTWLIDVFYDAQVYFICSTELAFKDLYTEGAFANEFSRTVSRLEDMQSMDYLQKSTARSV